ncbi:MAG TPA: response regulator transcription factor [Chitinophagaceae bacterium]|nr:response regulator transcription factor [Chitinophagaceae bacterium]
MDTPHPVKILVCDDHQLFRTGVRNSLRKYADAEIIGEAENGKVLLDMLENLQPDIILLNIQMPVLDGIETLPILRKEFPHIKVIILSMHNDPAVICKMLELGASCYLTKDVTSAEIYEAIKACAGQWFYMNCTMQKAIASYYNFPNEKQDAFSKETLSENETKILVLLAENTPEEEIAIQLNLTKRTISTIIDNLKRKAEVNTKKLLLAAARKEKIIKKMDVFARLSKKLKNTFK